MTTEVTMSVEYAFDRILQKLQAQVDRAEREAATDNITPQWSRGFLAASKIALEDAEMLKGLIGPEHDPRT